MLLISICVCTFQMAYESVKRILKFCRRETASSYKEIDQILPSIFHLIMKNTFGDVLSEALKTLQYLTDICNDIVIEDEVIKRIILLLSQNDIEIQKNAILIVCNIIFSVDEHMQLYLLKHFSCFLAHYNEDIRLKSMSCLSNLAASSQNGKQAIIEADLFPMILNNLKSGNIETIVHAVNVINKFSVGAKENHTIYLISTGTVTTFCELLKCQKLEVFNVIFKIVKKCVLKFHAKLLSISASF